MYTVPTSLYCCQHEKGATMSSVVRSAVPLCTFLRLPACLPACPSARLRSCTYIVLRPPKADRQADLQAPHVVPVSRGDVQYVTSLQDALHEACLSDQRKLL